MAGYSTHYNGLALSSRHGPCNGVIFVLLMADLPNADRFKSEMPRIPGVTDDAVARRDARKPPLALVAVFLTILLFVAVVVHFVMRPRRADNLTSGITPQLEVPAPAPDPATALRQVTKSDPFVATTEEMSKPWSDKDFVFRDRLTGENIPALLIRLPSGSPSKSSAYWGLVMTAAYGSCKLEYLTDLNKLRDDYGFHGAKHPMVGDPCSRTVFDPAKLTMLRGNVWVRGAIVQGSDLRPPLGIEIQVQGKNIMAVRRE